MTRSHLIGHDDSLHGSRCHRSVEAQATYVVRSHNNLAHAGGNHQAVEAVPFLVGSSNLHLNLVPRTHGRCQPCHAPDKTKRQRQRDIRVVQHWAKHQRVRIDASE